MYTPEYLASILQGNREPLPGPPSVDPGDRNSDARKRLVFPGEAVILELRLPRTPETFIEITYPSGYTEGAPRKEGSSPDHLHIPYNAHRKVLGPVLDVQGDVAFLDYLESFMTGYYRCAVFPNERIIRNVQDAPVEVSVGTMEFPEGGVILPVS